MTYKVFSSGGKVAFGRINNAPVVADSSYTCTGPGLTVPAPGLLSSCTDSSDPPLLAYVVTQPATGTVTVNTDGSFIYVRDGNDAYSTTFTYRVRDSGGLFSSPVTVTVNVAEFVVLEWDDSNATADYIAHNEFCKSHFNTDNQDLFYERLGTVLSFVDSGAWSYTSTYSATIAFQTNLPAYGHVEYDTDHRTDPEERPFFIHVHHITGLQPDTTYTYRLVAFNATGQVVSEEMTFTTRTFQNVVLVPSGLTGPPPYYLNQANTVYLLTEDIDAPTRAFNIAAQNVTLDLGGHTVTYDNATPLVTGVWNDYAYSNISSMGVARAAYVTVTGSKVLNGTIAQGQMGSAGDIQYGFNPIFNPDGMEIAGIRMRWRGDGVGGIIGAYSANYNIHHNIVEDHGSVVVNRHMAVRAIGVLTSTFPLHHNRLSRFRQIGVNASTEVHNNEFCGDSFATNSFCIHGSSVHNNFIFGTGYHCIGISWSSPAAYENYISLYAFACDRDTEYGVDGAQVGMRLTQYGGNRTVFNNYRWDRNIIVIRAQEGVIARGIQVTSDPYVTGFVADGNVIKIINVDGVTPADGDVQACLVVNAANALGTVYPALTFSNNDLYSNASIICPAESYGSGSYARFLSNRMTRIPGTGAFSTFQADYDYYQSIGHKIFDSVVAGGASESDYFFGGFPWQQTRSYSTGRREVVTILSGGTPVVGKAVSVRDSVGTVANGVTDVLGHVTVDILEHTYSAPQGAGAVVHTVHTGHVIVVDGVDYEFEDGLVIGI